MASVVGKEGLSPNQTTIPKDGHGVAIDALPHGFYEAVVIHPLFLCQITQ
jgi:hypothetical protein